MFVMRRRRRGRRCSCSRPAVVAEVKFTCSSPSSAAAAAAAAPRSTQFAQSVFELLLLFRPFLLLLGFSVQLRSAQSVPEPGAQLLELAGLSLPGLEYRLQGLEAPTCSVFGFLNRQ
jgi:hypothetical protein